MYRYACICDSVCVSPIHTMCMFPIHIMKPYIGCKTWSHTKWRNHMCTSLHVIACIRAQSSPNKLKNKCANSYIYIPYNRPLAIRVRANHDKWTIAHREHDCITLIIERLRECAQLNDHGVPRPRRRCRYVAAFLALLGCEQRIWWLPRHHFTCTQRWGLDLHHQVVLTNVHI